ncbi:hypothetical protein G9A89_019901 [Geosiphon pyriformis]|nr:hypothetical protein G9A89_019901 [Geosiphon pyriformis]
MPNQKFTNSSHEEIALVSHISKSPAEKWFDWLGQFQLQRYSNVITLLFALYVRWTVGLNGYSGYNSPPMYGDYEAQRHWMELTIHLPINQWYYYDPQWWGLDYPPLTAYVSWICGKIGSALNPEWFALDSSRGHESLENKVFMRASVIILEFIIYVPGIFVFVNWWLKDETRKKKARHIFVTLLILLQPALILIDNGHFQYNSVMLGLTVWGINCFMHDYDILGSIFFCLALSFKQMALYYSPAIFAYLLGKCIKTPRLGFVLFLKLGFIVVATFFVMFMPFLDSFEHFTRVITRIFPLQRGLYEDKVANVWCAVNVVVKLREILDIGVLINISSVATILAILPSCIELGRTADKRQLIYGLANSGLAFFLFAFQVHEKSILLPALPITLLILDEPLFSPWFINIAVFSLFPLLKKDDLVFPCFILFFLWNWLGSFFKQSGQPTFIKLIFWASHITMSFLLVTEYKLSPPKKYPDIYIVLNAIYSASLFFGFMLYFNYKQFAISTNSINLKTKKE